LTELFEKYKGGRFFWDTVYIQEPGNGILSRANFTLSPSLALLASLPHGTRAMGVSEILQCRTRYGIADFRRERHLHVYSAKRPPRWVSAHILVTHLMTYLLP